MTGRVTPGRAIQGLSAGAATGATLVALPLAAIAWDAQDLGSLLLGFIGLAYGLIGWSLGLLMIGLPGWWILHRLGMRSRKAAMIFGGLATLAVISALTWGPAIYYRSGFGDGVGVIIAIQALLTLLGVAVGWVVFTVAHRDSGAARAT